MKIKNIALYALAVPVAVFLITFILLYVFFKPSLEYSLKSAGMGHISVESATFGLQGTTLKNVRLDAESVIGELQLFATLDDLLAKTLTRLVVKDAKINPVTAMAALPESDKPAGAINLFAKQIDLQNIIINTDTPFGPLPVTLNGSVTDKGDAYQISAATEAKAAFADVTGQATAKIGKTDRKISAHLEIAEGRFEIDNLAMKRLSGWVSADIDLANPLPALNAQLTVGSLNAYGVPLQGTTLSLSSTAEKIQLVLAGKAQGDAGDINADVSLDRTDATLDKLSANIETKLKDLDALGLTDMTGEAAFDLILSGEKAKSAAPADLAAWKNLKGYASVNATRLSLPGLLSNASAVGKTEIAYAPETQVLTVKTFEGPFKFKGTVKSIDARPITLNIPEGIVAWDNNTKSTKIVVLDADAATSQVSLGKLTGDLTLWQGPVLEGKIAAGEIAHLGNPAYVIPLRLSAQFVPLSSLQNTTGFTGEITEKNGLLTAKFEGWHNQAEGKGNISISMPPMTLRQGVTELAQVFPISSVYIADGYGTIGLSAVASWSKTSRLATSGELYLKDFTATYDGNTVTNVSTVLKLDSLSPARFSNQSIAVGELFIGLPLTSGVVQASLDDKRNLSVHKMTWELAGGTVSAASFVLPLDRMETDVTLVASQLDLAQLFNIAPTKGLQATGKVNGNLPLAVRKDAITLTNGVLETSGPGTISYAVESMPAFLRDATNAQILDVRTVLSRFNYDSVRMIISGVAGGNQQIQLQIKGKNPLFYNGKPVNFNLNLEGPLQNVLKYKPGNENIPESIRSQLEGYEKKHGRK